MTIKQVKDNFNKEKRREAFNKFRTKTKNTGNQKANKSWQKDVQDFFSSSGDEEYYSNIEKLEEDEDF